LEYYLARRRVGLTYRNDARYGAIFANVMFFSGLFAEIPIAFESSDALRVGIVVPFLALIGAVMGALFGVPTGFAVGAMNGLLIGIITRAFFFSLRNARTYRRVIAVVSALFTSIASWLGFLAIMLFYANRDKANVGVLAVGVLIPALIAGVGAGLISRVIARWYEQYA
jgi:hypothetical protein